MNNEIKKLLSEHKVFLAETKIELEQLKKYDVTSLSSSEKQQIEYSIIELELEVSLREAFCSDLNNIIV